MRGDARRRDQIPFPESVVTARDDDNDDDDDKSGPAAVSG